MIKTLKLLCFFQFAFLVYAGVDFYIDSHIDTVARIFISSMLVFDGLLYIICIFVLKIHSSFVKIVFSTFILVNILFTFTDEFGLWDIIILLINIVILRLYFIIHKFTKN